MLVAWCGDTEIRIFEKGMNSRRVDGSRGFVIVCLGLGQGMGPVRHWYRAVVYEVYNRLPGSAGVRRVCTTADSVAGVLGARFGLFAQLPDHGFPYRLRGDRSLRCLRVLWPQQHGLVREAFGMP